MISKSNEVIELLKGLKKVSLNSVSKMKYKDSFSVNETRRLNLKDELKSIEFSMDSLQKMK